MIIFRNSENLKFCKKHNIRLSGPALGRPKKDAEIDKMQNYIDECERVEVEQKIQPRQTKMRHGYDRDKIQGNNLPQLCHIRFPS